MQGAVNHLRVHGLSTAGGFIVCARLHIVFSTHHNLNWQTNCLNLVNWPSTNVLGVGLGHAYLPVGGVSAV
jgi:hypothetical protein